jgi:hypothetical protein
MGVNRPSSRPIKGLVLKPYLKTQKKRNFPINPDVQAILADLRSPDTQSDDFLLDILLSPFV